MLICNSLIQVLDQNKAHLFIFISAEKRSAGAGNGQHIRPDPSAPVSRKGVLTSLLTGKQMPIPDADIVCIHRLYINKFIMYNFSNLQFGRCRFVSEFEKLNRIGEGTYGVVCKLLTWIRA
jgi:hypothetical protein